MMKRKRGRPPGPPGSPLGERIRSERQAQNLSQAALAARIGCSQKAVSQWESGARTHISAHYAVRMCQALPGLNPMDVFRLVAAKEQLKAGRAGGSGNPGGATGAARAASATAAAVPASALAAAAAVTSEITALLAAAGAYVEEGAERGPEALADGAMEGHVDALALAHERASAHVAAGEFAAASQDFELLAGLSRDLNMLYRLSWARSLLELGKLDEAARLLVSIDGRVALLAEALLESLRGSAAN